MPINVEEASSELALQERIKSLIAQGEFEMGQKISEELLARRLSVGKAPIRRAIASLAAIGIIQVKPRIGTFIFSLSEAEFDQLNLVRALLECAAIRLAMAGNAPGYTLAMRNNVSSAEALDFKDNYRRAYRQLDREFHKLSFVFAANPYLADAYETLDIKIWAMRSLLTFPDSHFQSSLNAHKSVVASLEAGDVEGACERLTEHIRKSFSDRERNLLSRIDS
ncbi:Transcriptional regulator, GntR family (plasmid) [Cupriavidus taiwanensis]|uniref:Transcriptional regulator, GntR family n=1 Tax=Cupriavidus taiwanensis TaxID=164546 RepID=A0A375IP86_9BURK|nr:Transcriptional regulator, GntR family [Cupriavidus taiwanensis]SOZ74566.1 Transcriptional regulator, GntR family [Cupriavidus taiwanensis]SPA20993.1 Transcriptional regulator, GntR family [Cupriavidus taiwanensis]SPD56212.1 Transcriptional regulator, GntR family [Cupriavidus taiwanensis]SPK75911.1 Transcriptional regulator, GntR family [Cupriavidus taiwanensis]